MKYNFKTWNVGSDHNRYYIDIDALACVLGAMIEESIEDLRFNGFSTSEGGPGGSSSHWNGMVGDFGYLNKDGDSSFSTNLFSPDDQNKVKLDHFDYERQVKFNNALYKFGFSKFQRKMLTEKFKLEEEDTEYTILPHANHYVNIPNGVRHYHHLHIQGLDLSFINTID